MWRVNIWVDFQINGSVNFQVKFQENVRISIFLAGKNENK